METDSVLGYACGLASVVIVLSHHFEECGFVGDAERRAQGLEKGRCAGDFGEKHRVFLGRYIKIV